jgi:hypothetical protein
MTKQFHHGKAITSNAYQGTTYKSVETVTGASQLYAHQTILQWTVTEASKTICAPHFTRRDHGIQESLVIHVSQVDFLTRDPGHGIHWAIRITLSII